MTYRLSADQYGKAESHIVRIYRDRPRHEIRDLTVTTALQGDFADAYVTGDQGKVLPTDTQKNTAYAYAKLHGDGTVEQYALALATHFVDGIESVRRAQVDLFVDAWDRVVVDGAEHDHTWVRRGPENRTARIVVEGEGGTRSVTVTGGVKDLVILKSTGSEFQGFLKDEFTTLGETDDRILATAIDATWRFSRFPADWDAAYAAARQAVVATFATRYSLALQQTLWQIGGAVLDAVPEVDTVTLRAPNKHHFAYDFTRFAVQPPIANRNEVFHADDRPYGLIEATVTR
ncbi:factor-independent urate hydroxylase [Gryllotalpicola ginsengisoli]|uniref:factor-independent urate hydroxylase n=1 Tax=Gryllotalpicola ginsengisoli TaxID=444608 RepID=UPI0003B36AB1|nr:urate oxidase [Gryllotalpicola ginsengisoli]